MTNFIEPYNPNWKSEFEKIKQVIESELKELYPLTDIQHVGSTAIPGLFAKPILDIDIIIDHKDLLLPISLNLEKLGYKNKGEQGIEGRFAFRQTSNFVPLSAMENKWQQHHLYVCYKDSLALKNHLLFRDILRNNKAVMEQYAALKQYLFNGLKLSGEEYNIRKTDFIISVLATTGLDETALRDITNANSRPLI